MPLGRLLRASVSALLALPLLVSCAQTAPRPRAPELANLPPFLGHETDRWLVEEVGPVGRDDVLPAFEASAENYGCSTTTLDGETTSNIYGERRSHYGVTASCYEGTISLITLVGGGVLIGCAKPTTIQACRQLLHDISESR